MPALTSCRRTRHLPRRRGHLHRRPGSYSEGKSTLSAGYAAYYAGKKQLEEGKAAYAAGKKQIEDNTAAYNEGKATLAKIEPLMPYVDQYVKFRNGTISNLAGFATAQAWFVSVVRPIAPARVWSFRMM